MRFVLPVTLLLLSACGAREDAVREPLTEREDEAGTSRPAREALTAAPGTAETGTAEATAGLGDPTEVPTAEVPVPPLALTRLTGPSEAEDGAGHASISETAVAIDLDARRFPARALDPVLFVGEMRFIHYHHPRIGTLRFVAAEHALLVDGAEVSIQYGDDVASRTVIEPHLTVPAEVRR